MPGRPAAEDDDFILAVERNLAGGFFDGFERTMRSSRKRCGHYVPDEEFWLCVSAANTPAADLCGAKTSERQVAVKLLLPVLLPSARHLSGVRGDRAELPLISRPRRSAKPATSARRPRSPKSASRPLARGDAALFDRADEPGRRRAQGATARHLPGLLTIACPNCRRAFPRMTPSPSDASAVWRRAECILTRRA